jgi:nondiscriminating aspartyl-tRNA synthetase
MSIEDEIGGWRRTHYSSQLNPRLNNEHVTIMGYIASIRDHGNIVFVMLADKDGEVQLVFKKGKEASNSNSNSNDSNTTTPATTPTASTVVDGYTSIPFSKVKSLKEHSCIAVKGRVKVAPNAPKGIEVVPEELKVLSLARSIPPFSVYSKTFPNLDLRLNLRAIDLRRYYMKTIFRIRHKVLKAIREFLDKEGFIEVNTPKIISTASEGGASLFPVFYFDREAFLAQSPQLYKEQLVTAFEKVFEIAPIFRAEPSRTNRHLAEAISVDVEEAFVDYKDVMNLLERMVTYTIEYIVNNASDELKVVNPMLTVPKTPFPRYTYDEVIDILRKNGYSIEWGDDLSSEHLASLGKVINGYYFIVDWPSSIRPFYTKSNGKVAEAFDLMYNDLEISSGSSRINKKEELIERLKIQGLRVEAFEYHLKVFDYGMPPHAGFGLGLERFLMTIARLDNIRDATFYPRDIDRLVP